MSDNRHTIRREASGLVVREWLNGSCGFFYAAHRRLMSHRSPYQKIDILETQGGPALLLDNVTQVVADSEFQYHEPMVHPAMCTHAGARDVLVIGGGDGGIVREVLKYPRIRSVTVAELDPSVIACGRTFLSSMNEGALDSPKVQCLVTDGRAHVEQSASRYDIIIMDMTDPFGPSRMLYTREFFVAARKALRGPRGVFVMHGESPAVRPFAHACIGRTLRSAFSHVNCMYVFVQMYAALWSVYVSSQASDISRVSAGRIDRRLEREGVKGLRLYTGSTHHAMLTRYPYLDAIAAGRARVIRDGSPDFTDNIHSSR